MRAETADAARFDGYTYSSFPPALYRRFLETYVVPYGTRFRACLDLGCGSGGLIEELARWHDGEVVGVDVSRACIEACRARGVLARPGITFRQADAAALAAEADLRGRFDLVLSYSVLHLMPGDTPSKLRILAALTAPGGLVAVDALARVPWNRAMFGFVKLLMRTGLWRTALLALRPLIGPSFPKAFIEDLSRMSYLRDLRYGDFVDLRCLVSPDFSRDFELVRLEVVPQDGFFTGRKARFTLRRR
jgi:SAM-dependent methyltransferase